MMTVTCHANKSSKVVLFPRIFVNFWTGILMMSECPKNLFVVIEGRYSADFGYKSYTEIDKM